MGNIGKYEISEAINNIIKNYFALNCFSIFSNQWFKYKTILIEHRKQKLNSFLSHLFLVFIFLFH